MKLSTRILSFTLNGNESAVLNPTDNLNVTSLFASLYITVEIPTPLVLFIGRITGVVLLNPNGFLKMLTLVSPKEYLISISFTISFVVPSKTNNLGATLYPLPTEVIPISSNEDNKLIFEICGIEVSGDKVLSVGFTLTKKF